MISKRLKELREEKGLLQKDIAKYLNISTSAYGYYEQGKRNPDTEAIKNLADFFDVSADYLLGRTNSRMISNLCKNETRYESYNEVKEAFIEKLIVEGIITEDETIPRGVFEKALKYGMDAAIEILKLEKKLEK